MNRIRVGLAALLVAVLAAATLARVDRGGRDDGDHARGNRQHRTRAHQAPSAAGLTLAQFHRIARGAGFGIGDGDGVGDGGEVEAEDVRRGDDWFLGRRAYPRRQIPDGA